MTKWVFKLKRYQNGRVERFKARIVARGFEQRAGIDFKKTFAAVASLEFIRAVIAIAANKDYKMKRFDVATAFLNGDLKKVYIEPPAGINLKSNKCLILQRAISVLRQAPRAWSSKFNETMRKLGFKPTLNDPCVYTNKKIIVCTYVDDGVVVARIKEECKNLIQRLNCAFKTNMVEGSVFLGIEITASRILSCVKIVTLKNTTALQTMMEASKNVSARVEKSQNLQFEKMEKLRLNTAQVAINSANMVWLASDLYYKIRETAEALYDYKVGKVILKAISRLINNRALAQIRHTHARWTRTR